MLDWYFRGFCDELSPWLRYIQPPTEAFFLCDTKVRRI